VPTSHRSIRSLAVVLLLLFGACGGGGEEEVGPNSSAATGSTTSSSTNGTTPTSEDDNTVPGPPWGPDDPLIPGQYGAFAKSSTADFDCETVDRGTPDDEFWTKVAAVCRALRGDGKWPVGPLVDPAPADNGFQDCLNDELAAVVRVLLELSDADPGQPPRLELAQASARSPCEYRIYEPDVVTNPPTENRPTGGVTVTVHVPSLGGDHPTVLVDGHEATDTSIQTDEDNDGLARIEIFLPAPVEAHSATITVERDFGVQTGPPVALPDVDVPETTTTTLS
jgi:hypothetical protein